MLNIRQNMLFDMNPIIRLSLLLNIWAALVVVLWFDYVRGYEFFLSQSRITKAAIVCSYSIGSLLKPVLM